MHTHVSKCKNDKIKKFLFVKECVPMIGLPNLITSVFKFPSVSS
jgi:hypothetical protein